MYGLQVIQSSRAQSVAPLVASLPSSCFIFAGKAIDWNPHAAAASLRFQLWNQVHPST